MSPDKRADLDAELAALEAELAELEGRKKASKPAKAAKADSAPAPAASPAPAKPEEKKRSFGFGRKKAAEPAAAPGAPSAAPPAHAPPPQAPVPVAPDVAARPPLPRTDGSLWRHEEGAWVRTVARTRPVVRRVLDEEERVVREEPAGARDVDEVGAVKAERGVGRLFRRKKDG